MPVIIRPEHRIPEAYINGTQLVAGVDEAGRGPLVGAVVAAAVILDPDRPVEGLADSKKLSAARREQLEYQIKQAALAWSVASVPASRIDEINILNATFEAMNQAITSLNKVADIILIDGNKTPQQGDRMIAIIKGDQRVDCISAASILAKVARDREMLELDARFPEYGFARHKGYPTKIHLEALQQHGPIVQHRRSYGPVSCLVSKDS